MAALPWDVIELIVHRGSIFDIEDWRRTNKELSSRLDSQRFWEAVLEQRVRQDPFFVSEDGMPPWPERLSQLQNRKWRVICIEVEAFLRTGQVRVHFDRSGDSRITMANEKGANGDVFITREGDQLKDAIDPVIAKAALTIDHETEEVINLAEDGEQLAAGTERRVYFDAVMSKEDAQLAVETYRTARDIGGWYDSIWVHWAADDIDVTSEDRDLFLALLYLMLMRGYRWVEPPELATRRMDPGEPPRSIRARLRAHPSARWREVRVATWNIRNLGTRADRTRRFDQIAKYISQMDVVAVQELMKLPALDKILALLPPRYRYIHTQRKASREYYAYFYDSEAVTLVGSGQFDDSKRDAFIREPFVATFKSRHGFDFTLLNVHVYYGNGKKDRRPEVRELAKAAAEALRRNGKEENLILLGDFNLPPGDSAWEPVRRMGFVPLLRPPAKTTVGGVSLLDNIWMRRGDVMRYVVRYGFAPFDRGVPREKARREISDHRPVWVILRASVDEDEDEYGDLSQLRIARRAFGGPFFKN
jgi:endonuclease/exonuclease/phosphatase family metal-dependent hydrolase